MINLARYTIYDLSRAGMKTRKQALIMRGSKRFLNEPKVFCQQEIRAV